MITAIHRKPTLDRSKGTTIELPSKQAYVVMAVTESGVEELLTILSWDGDSDNQEIEEQAQSWATSRGGDGEESWTYKVYEIASVALTGKRVVKAKRRIT